MASVIEEARALLAQFERSPLLDLYWRGRDWSVFIAREGGSANPMLLAAPPTDVSDLSLLAVTAPHLGLFEPACTAGEIVAGGALIGLIDVLGRKTKVFSSQAGRVAAICAPANRLVEFGELLVELDVAE